MAGLVEEGVDVMSEAEKKEDAPADLALIGAAQRVEHYETVRRRKDGTLFDVSLTVSP